MNKKLVPVEKFMEVALANGYEVFDEAQVAAYAKDFMTKSQAGEVLQEDKAEFAVEMAGLQKAICANEDGSQCTLYYRKPLVDWKVDSNGLVMKGIAGTYTDTPENRKLNRVGQAYVASPDVIKAIYGDIKKSVEEDKAVVDAELAKQADSIKKSCLVVTADADRRLALGEIDEALCKSVKGDINLYLTSWGDTLDECCDVVKSEDLADVREDLADASAAFADLVKAAHGRYADNAKNRRLHRVGQEYGKAAQEDEKSGEKPSRNGDSVKRDISILEENKDRIVEKYGQEAYDKKIEALKKEGEDFEQKETVKQLKERADKQDAEEEERKKAEKRAKRQERRRARHAAKREAAKKAKEEAEAKAKAEAEKKQKQEPEKKKQESSEEDTKKKVRDFIKNGLDGAVDSAMKRFVADFYGGKGEHLNASDYVNSGDFQEYLRKYLPAGITTEDLKGAVVSSVNRGIERRNGIEREEKLKEFKRLEALRDGATAKEAEDFANKVYADTIGRAEKEYKHDLEDGKLPYGAEDYQKKYAREAFDNAKFEKDKKDYGYMDKGDVEYIMDDASVQYGDIDELLSTIKEHGISSDPDEMKQGAISTEFSGDAFAHEASILIPGMYNRVRMQNASKGKQPEKFYSLNLKLKNGRTLRDFNMGRVTRDDIESAHLQVNHPKDNTYTIEREKINLDKVPIRAL